MAVSRRLATQASTRLRLLLRMTSKRPSLCGTDDVRILCRISTTEGNSKLQYMIPQMVPRTRWSDWNDRIALLRRPQG